jgi:uncharacterized membrane protein
MICNLITSKDKAGFVTYSTYKLRIGGVIKCCTLTIEIVDMLVTCDAFMRQCFSTI